jgi:hypothetical protein
VDAEARQPVLGRHGRGAWPLPLFAAGLLAALTGAWPAPARGEPATGIDVRDARVFLVGDTLAVEVRLDGFWSPRVRGSLERGMPATLVVTADLWRDRSGWFDRMVASRSVVYRVRYDAWREDYVLQRNLEAPHHLPSLAAAGAALSQPLRLAAAEAREVEPRRRHYVVITASLRPLTPEGVREVERFLSSQLRNSGGSDGGGGLESIAHLPSSLLSMLAALSGLGDEIATYRTPVFVLPGADRPAGAP